VMMPTLKASIKTRKKETHLRINNLPITSFSSVEIV